jgi:DNA polymerase III delta prime subunit
MTRQNTYRNDRWIRKYQAEEIGDFYGLESNFELIRGLKNRKSYNGILIFGPPGSGKTSFGHWLFQYMGCEGNTMYPCGECKPCMAFESAFASALFDGAWINDDSRVKQVLSRTTHPGFDLFIDNLDLSEKLLCRMLLGRMDYYHGGRLILAASDLQFIPKPLQQRCLIIRLSYNEVSMIQLAKKICTAESILIENQESLKELIGLTNNNPRCLINVLEIIGLKDRKIDQDICCDQDLLANCNPADDSLKKNVKKRQRK